MDASESDIEPVRRVEAALRSLGATGGDWTRRTEEPSWFVEWVGDLIDVEVYIGLMGHGQRPDMVRVLLDDWVFDHVVVDHLDPFLRAVSSGRARLTDERWLLLFTSQVLEIPVGDRSYFASRAVQHRDSLAEWERNLFVD
ncbi:hypothetical protein ABZ348_33235 [Streptomyces sp. NPDC005963]|uniref:hypothetical protein n=1 Tax=Streptomyces sp. NPDC005963 TaxID=3156721 RepID=UPI0033EE6280